jgi:DNA-binding SARP family transcriptional activator/tetratricopeptide (TPR) repeat protein
MRFGLLGPLVVFDDAGEELVVAAARQRTLLAALLFQANQPVPADALADAVWDGAPPPGHVATLRSYVMRLRKALGREAAERLVTRDPGYLIHVDEPELDVTRFEALCHDAGVAARAGAWADASGTAMKALALWRSAPLADVPSQVLRGVWVPRLEQLRTQVVEWHVEADLQLGHYEPLISTLHDLVAQYPLRESLYAALMRALAGAGQRAEALDVYQRARRVLVDELGIEPGAQLCAVHRRILAGDRDPLVARPPAVPGGATVARQLPAAVRHFAGRTDELKILSELLDEAGQVPSTVVISAIAGTAGIGKTALAVHWAHQVADRFPDGQLYVNLRGFDSGGVPMAPGEAIRGFLDALGVTPQRIPTTIDAQVALYRSLLAGRRILMVLDNARDAEQVRPLLPGSPGPVAVVTSRTQLTSLVVAESAHLINLDLLDVEDARDLLGRRLGRHRTAAEPEATDTIIVRCAGLPLALAIVAARTATNRQTPLAAVAADLADAHTGLSTLSTGDAVTDIRAVFSWSYRTLSSAAAKLFRLLGPHPGPDISMGAAASLAGLPREQVQPVLAELAQANLLVERARGRYTLHDLLRAYATDLARRTDSEQQRRAATLRLLDHYLHTAHAADRLLDPHRDTLPLAAPQPGVAQEHHTGHHEALTWFTTEHSVLLAAIEYASATGSDTHSWQLAWAVTNFLDQQGRWHKLSAVWITALAAAERLADPSAQAYAHRLLAYAYTRLDRIDDAADQFRRALDLSRSTGDRLSQAHIHRKLGLVYAPRGRYRDALDHALQALELYGAVGDRLGHARALNNVGWYHAQLGDHEQALTYCRQALAPLREIGDGQGEAAVWDSIGQIHGHLGDHAQARTCLERALDLYRALGDRYSQGTTLIALGDAYHRADDADAASGAWRQALAVLDALDHPDTAKVRRRLDQLDDADAPAQERHIPRLVS